MTTQKQHAITCCLLTLGILSSSVATRAEVPNQSVEKLKSSASHIVVGKVTKFSHKTTKSENYEDTDNTAEISVTSVEKGDGIKTGDVIKVQYWNKTWIGKGSPPPGSNGHRGIPKKDATTRVYLQQEKGNLYKVILPNGFEPTKPEAK